MLTTRNVLINISVCVCGFQANFMKRPNIIVHLDVTPEESLRRINLRSRDCESNVSIGFLRALHEAYEEFIEDVARAIPVIKVACTCKLTNVYFISATLSLHYIMICQISTVQCLLKARGKSFSSQQIALHSIHSPTSFAFPFKVSYEEFQTAEAMAARIKTEYENIANIRHVAFPPKPKSPAPANASKPADKTT